MIHLNMSNVDVLAYSKHSQYFVLPLLSVM